MPYNTKEKKLTIDLSKENYDPKMLLANKEVTCIRIDECIEQFELPVALKEYKNLTELYISGENRDILYPPPLHLEKLTNIKELSLWSYCDLEKLEPMPHIEILNIVIKKPYNDVQIISNIFPNLKKMEIWGSHQKEELPPEIGNLKNLEHLALWSFELTDLPPEFKKLTNLKFLGIGGRKMKIFPEVLCELGQLEELAFAEKIITLPNNFSNLKALKKLDFSRSFNKGILLNDRWSDKPTYLRSIPEVIGKLTSLQELDLSYCGVVNLAFLKPLKALKKLRIKSSGLKDCNELSHLHSLEELNLEAGKALVDINGLAGLPIKRLNLEYCDELKSITPIMELPTLEELNIERCSFENLDAIYQHPNLKVLKASEALVKKWKFKGQYKKMPPLNAVIDNLPSEKLAVSEKAMNDLALYVDKNYNSDNNPLAGFFGIDDADEEEEVIDLPILDAAFKKYKNKLSVDTLINLVKMSFQSVEEDNYTITLLAIKEIIKRKDVDAQKQVIALFDEACGGYDYGHRYHGITVHDQLFDHLFKQFESAALIDLLTDAHGDMLNCEGGDEGDRLFIPAFKKCTNDADFDLLLIAFFGYQDESIGYYGFQYFSTLHNEILAVLTKKYALKFTDEMKKRGPQTKLSALLESNNSKDIEQLIEVLDKKENKKFAKSNYCGILLKINQLDISLDHVTTALDFFIKIKKEGSRYVPDTLLKYMLPNGKETVITYLKTKENRDNKKYIEKVVSGIINKCNHDNVSMEDTQFFRDYLRELKQQEDDNETYNIEIESLFKTFRKTPQDNGALLNQLTRFEEIIDLIKPPLTKLGSGDIRFGFGFMLDDPDVIKRLFNTLVTVLEDPSDIAHILTILVVSAGTSKDHNFMLSILEHIPETIEEDLLAYNLACAFSIFSEKEPMLKYIRRSLELGKTKAQFLDDKDFTQYKDDKDFLKALEIIG